MCHMKGNWPRFCFFPVMYDASKIYLRESVTQKHELQNYCYTKNDMNQTLSKVINSSYAYLKREVNMVLGRNVGVIIFAVLLLITGAFPYFYLFIFF